MQKSPPSFHEKESKRVLTFRRQVVKTYEGLKRSKKGRPGKNETPEYREIYKLRIEVGELDQKAYEPKKEHMSCFVLISNVSTDYSSYDILNRSVDSSVKSQFGV